MRKVLLTFLAICLALALAACAEGGTLNQPVVETPAPVQTEEPVVPAEVDEPEPPFDGKIAIITHAGSGDYYRNTALSIIDKYGEDKIIQVLWPAGFGEFEKMTDIVVTLGNDPEIKAIIVNTAWYGTSIAFEKLREMRKDIYVIYWTPDLGVDAGDYAQTADLILMTDNYNMGSAMVNQARKLGAETFVHYSVTRYMFDPIVSERREQIRRTCDELGIKFIDETVPDEIYGSQDVIKKYYQENVQKFVEKYGKNTAFFSVSCAHQGSLINAVVDAGAIYPQPCCPSPFHGFLGALDIDSSIVDFSGRPYEMYPEDAISQAKAILNEKNMLGRFSTWPVEDIFMFPFIAAEYAIKWINGEAPKEGVDVDILKQLMEDYAGVEVYLTPYKDEYPYTENGTGETYDNFLLMRMDYITFE